MKYLGQSKSETSMEWLNDPWVVGIGGGILSGILVSFISRKFFSRRDRREYNQKLQSANREIIYALRPGIAEGHVPGRRTVQSLINSTARKYAIDESDLYDPIQIGEELTKEIMDSSFISANTKQEYCKQLDSLAPISPPEVREEASEISELKPRTDLAEYRSRMVWMMSMMIGVMTAMMTMAVGFFNSPKGDGLELELLSLLLPTIIAFVTILMGAMLMLFRNE
ncbi:MAG: hypothetical protein OXH31_08825, partial [Gammaproteobacteria bacterium]|nr:hypothetical protein [Gammaproteobacteria bacterium]